MTWLIICAGSPNVWDDLKAVKQHFGEYFVANKMTGGTDTMAINDIGMYLPGPLKHWYTNHGMRFRSGWNEVRAYRRREFPACQNFHTTSMITMNRDCPKWVQQWDVPPDGGSGLCGAKVAVKLGYERIILCGVSCENTGHFYGPRNFNEAKNPDILKNALERAIPVFGGRVRSCSGISREILGSPFDPW